MEPDWVCCDRCGAEGTESTFEDVSFTGPYGEYHERFLCRECYQAVMDEAISHMGDYE